MSKNIYTCKNCSNQFQPKNKRYSTFCSQSCSASYNNRERIKTKESKKKIGYSLKNKYNRKRYPFPKSYNHHLSPRNKKNITGKYTKIFLNKCKHCNYIFFNRQKMKYCEKHKNLYGKNNRNLYTFTFDIYDYPDLFNIKSIKEKGFYSPRKDGKNVDLNKFTRDHKISVTEAIKNNYDPYYIKHPLNCEIMSMKENNIKNDKSSITYEELVILVNNFDSIHS